MNTQNKVEAVLAKNIWIGWIFLSLIQHMQKETEYFRRKLEGPEYTEEEEIKFIDQHHAEEMGATAQLLDPAPENQPVIDKVRSYALKTMKDWSPEDLKILKDIKFDLQVHYYMKIMLSGSDRLFGL